MSDFSLTLGPVAFAGFEMPSSITLGGKQRLAIHKLPGGIRIIDAIGADPADLAWSGIFTGPDAADRARILDTMRVAGLQLLLSWDAFLYTVVIDNFEADYRSPWWIPYRLSCTVVRDEAAALVTGLLSITPAITDDLATAGAFAARSGRSRQRPRRHHGGYRRLHHSHRGAEHHGQQPSLPNCFGRARHTGKRCADGGNRLRTARPTHRRPRLHGTGSPQPRRRQYLGDAMQTITVAGGNLFQIAAAQLGDATQWIRIAQLNGISDPMLNGLVTLNLPDPNPAAGGGIANQ